MLIETVSSSMDAPGLESFLVPGSDRVYYLSNFITEDEELYLIRKIQETPRSKWRSLANRRLQLLGGELSTKNSTLLPQEMPSFVANFPDLLDRLRKTGAFTDSPHGVPNHIILNEYLPGQGIMPHQDGPAYYPVVATLSLGSTAVFHYYAYNSNAPQPLHGTLAGLADDDKGGNGGDQDHQANGGADKKGESEQGDQSGSQGRTINPVPRLSLLLERRSLVITTSRLYTDHLHGIDDIVEDMLPVFPLRDDDEAEGAEEKAMDSTPPCASSADRDESEVGVDEMGMEAEAKKERVGHELGQQQASRLANESLLQDEIAKAFARQGGVLPRETRYSLTCRDVERVWRARVWMAGAAAAVVQK